MLLSDALNAPLATLRPRDIWEAIKTIGKAKLAMRQDARWRRRLAEFAPLNRRLDDLLVEQECRRRPVVNAERK